MPRRRVIAKRDHRAGSAVPEPARDEVHQYGDDRRQAQHGGAHLLQELRHHQGKDQRRSLKVFKKAIDNVKPSLEVKSRRVAGSNYQVAGRGQSQPPPLAQHPLDRRLRHLARRRQDDAGEAGERTDGRRQSARRAVKKREDTHRMAEANKAFAHYRW